MKVEEIITDRILTMLEKGTIPWKQSWKGGSLPMNYVSQKPYQGINVFLLCSLGYQSPYFLIYNQAKTLGGNVKQGEKGYPVIFWKILDIEKENKQGELKTERLPLMRYYTVFRESAESATESAADLDLASIAMLVCNQQRRGISHD